MDRRRRMCDRGAYGDRVRRRLGPRIRAAPTRHLRVRAHRAVSGGERDRATAGEAGVGAPYRFAR